MRFVIATTERAAREMVEQYQGIAAYITLGDAEGLLRFVRIDTPLMLAEVSNNLLLQGRASLAFLASSCFEAAREGGLSVKQSLAIVQTYLRQAEEANSEAPVYRLMLPMMLELAEAVQSEGVTRVRPLSHQAVLYARSHLDAKLDGESVAYKLGVSRKTLCTRFRSETGETFAAFIRRLRLERAQRLLDTTSDNIALIARQTGFSSQSHLQTAFRHATGITPREWRLRGDRQAGARL